MSTDTPRRGPLVIAHRGFSASYPENTALAFAKALELDIDGCECDVHLSADGVPFLLHDQSSPVIEAKLSRPGVEPAIALNVGEPGAIPAWAAARSSAPE